MNLGRRGNSDDGVIPTFVFPHSLTFYADEPNTCAQQLHIYNPFPYAIQFKVLSNATHKYKVTDSEGTINPNSFVDVLIRNSAVHSRYFGQTDKFRIIISKIGQSKYTGKREVLATLYPTKKYEDDNSSSEAERFEQSLPILPSTNKQAHQYRIIDSAADRRAFTGSKLVFIVAAVICMLALTLPTQGVDKSDLPPYLHLTVSQKLICSYALGLLTLVILQN